VIVLAKCLQKMCACKMLFGFVLLTSFAANVNSVCIKASTYSPEKFESEARVVCPGMTNTTCSIQNCHCCCQQHGHIPGMCTRSFVPVACSTDVLPCADGSFVSRKQPSCDFDACPDVKVTVLPMAPPYEPPSLPPYNPPDKPRFSDATYIPPPSVGPPSPLSKKLMKPSPPTPVLQPTKTPHADPPSIPPCSAFCCLALIPKCLACKACQTETQWCYANPTHPSAQMCPSLSSVSPAVPPSMPLYLPAMPPSMPPYAPPSMPPYAPPSLPPSPKAQLLPSPFIHAPSAPPERTRPARPPPLSPPTSSPYADPCSPRPAPRTPAAPAAVAETCPKEAPRPQDKCSHRNTNCEYDKVCCQGGGPCFFTRVASCDGNIWVIAMPGIVCPNPQETPPDPPETAFEFSATLVSQTNSWRLNASDMQQSIRHAVEGIFSTSSLVLREKSSFIVTYTNISLGTLLAAVRAATCSSLHTDCTVDLAVRRARVLSSASTARFVATRTLQPGDSLGVPISNEVIAAQLGVSNTSVVSVRDHQVDELQVLLTITEQTANHSDVHQAAQVARITTALAVQLHIPASQIELVSLRSLVPPLWPPLPSMSPSPPSPLLPLSPSFPFATLMPAAPPQKEMRGCNNFFCTTEIALASLFPALLVAILLPLVVVYVRRRRRRVVQLNESNVLLTTENKI